MFTKIELYSLEYNIFGLNVKTNIRDEIWEGYFIIYNLVGKFIDKKTERILTTNVSEICVV